MKILICDKDQVFGEKLVQQFSEYETHLAKSAVETGTILQKDSSFQIVVIDFTTLSSEDTGFLKKISQYLSVYRVIMLVSFSNRSFENVMPV